MNKTATLDAPQKCTVVLNDPHNRVELRVDTYPSEPNYAKITIMKVEYNPVGRFQWFGKLGYELECYRDDFVVARKIDAKGRAVSPDPQDTIYAHYRYEGQAARLFTFINEGKFREAFEEAVNTVTTQISVEDRPYERAYARFSNQHRFHIFERSDLWGFESVVKNGGMAIVPPLALRTED